MSTYQQQDFKKKKSFAQPSDFTPLKISAPQVGGSGESAGDKAECKFCGKRHGGKECWMTTGKCLRCGSPDHKIKDCPKVQFITSKAPVAARAVPATAKPIGRPRALARVFALAREDIERVEHVTEGTLSISGFHAKILFDTGATHSFMSK